MVRLRDPEGSTYVCLIPDEGNRIASFAVRGREILHPPGIPFFAPWINRTPDGLEFDSGLHQLQPPLGNLQFDSSGIPIHGVQSVWSLAESGDSHAVSRLNYRDPAALAQWPLPHCYEMTCRVAPAELTVTVAITNHAAERMPVLVGFHPYFKLPGEPWQLTAPPMHRMPHDPRVIPTGELIPTAEPLLPLDSAYTRIGPTPVFTLSGPACDIEVEFGPTWPVAILWSPPGAAFACVEPMAAPTNGLHLHRRGLWPDLQWIPPGDTWRGWFRVRFRSAILSV